MCYYVILNVYQMEWRGMGLDGEWLHCTCLYIFLQLFVRRIVPYILLGIMRHRNVHYYYY